MTEARGVKTRAKSSRASRIKIDRSGPAVLEATGLRRTFGTAAVGVAAVDGVDLTLHAGEVVVLMGPSGSGKSTLLHLLSGLDTPTAGEVRVGDRSLAGMSETERAVWRGGDVGFVLQRDNLIPSLTLAENVAAPMMLAGRGRGEALEEARRALEEVGVAHRADAWPSDVSGGEAQRAAVARACCGTRKLVFADEPTGALDSESGAVVLSLLVDMARRSGAATMMVTHSEAVAKTGDRVLHMIDGRLRDE